LNAANDIFKRAEQATKKGNLEYAIELLLQGLTLNPKAADQRRVLHQIETRHIENQGGNPQGGMGVKLKTMPTLANAKKLALQKKFEEVVVELEKALRLQPKNAGLLFQLAQALEQIEAQDSAIGVLEEVVEVEKTHVDAYRNLGRLLAARGEVESAIAYWEKLRMFKPDDKEASKAIRDLSAANLVKRAEDRQAQSGDESFKALLKDESESADLEKKAKVLRTDADRRQAIAFKMDELRKERTNSRLWRELGALYQDLKDWDRALQAFKNALKVNPHDLFAHDKIGALQELRAEEEVVALRDQVEALGQNGSDGAKLEELREKLREKEKEHLEFRVQEYERRVKAHPTDYDLKIRFGQILMEAARYDEAIEQFQKSVKDPKLKVLSQNLMGRCFQLKKVYAVAVAQYLEALKGVADPDSEVGKEIKYNLAVASEEQGDRDTALKYYQAIMATDIGYRDISSRVDRLMNAH
jgi:tetratricopeptide (TPR) repeat protein